MNGHTDRDCKPVCDGLDADGYGCLCDCHPGAILHRCYDERTCEYGPTEDCPACLVEQATRREIGEYLTQQLDKEEQ